MPAGTQDLSIEKRASFSITLTLKNSDGSAFNLSGASLASQIRVDSSNKLQANFTTGIIGDPSNGIATLSLTKDQTSSLSISPSSYDFFVDNADGSSNKLLRGSVTIIDNKTA